jgi:lipopolysaccharide export system permease protein
LLYWLVVPATIVFLRPYLIGGILLAALLWVGSRYWIPKANIIRSNFQSNYIDKKRPHQKTGYPEIATGVFYKRIDSNTYVGLKSYDTATKSAAVFFMEKVKGNKVIYNLRGNPIQWNKTTGKWKLSNALERIIDSSREVIRRYDSLIIDLKLQPEELRKDDYLKDKLTTPELVKFIKQEELRGTEGLSALKVERYRRTATPFAVLLLTIIGAVIASRKTRGGSGMHLAMGIIIAATFIISDRFFNSICDKRKFSTLGSRLDS